MATTVSASVQSSTVEIGKARPLFDVRPLRDARAGLIRYLYDVAPDGQRFLVNTPEEPSASAPITLVVNWPAGLKK